MPDKPLTVEQVLNVLAETPPRLAALTDGLTPAELRTAPDHDEWSATDVLAHLRSCADVWGGCIATILAEDMPAIRAVNPTTWIKSTDYPELEFRPSLQAFIAQRTDLLAVLEALPPADWSRAATVTGAGRPLERTVFSFAQRLARHERSHVKQVGRIVTSMHDARLAPVPSERRVSR
jgi:hypothetical protein